jgi:GAF domain-containing protein
MAARLRRPPARGGNRTDEAAVPSWRQQRSILAATPALLRSRREPLGLAVPDSPSAGAAVVSTDLDADRGRWPLFASFAIAAGFRSVVALPLRLREQTIGGLNLFDSRAVPVTEDDQRLAQALADVATIGILQQRSAHRSTMLAGHLQRPLRAGHQSDPSRRS